MAAACFLIAGCTSSDRLSGPIDRVDTYVSLGDSYVSGAGIDNVDPGSLACQRSDHNYPSLLADALRARTFTDVSCAGSSTKQLLGGFTLVDGTLVPPQVDAIKADTQLVTVGIGANNSLVLVNLWNTCRATTLNPTVGSCETYVRDRMPGFLKNGRAEVSNALAIVAKKAPRAKIVLVGYLRLVPDKGVGGCLAAGFGPAQAAIVSKGEKLLDASQAAAAKKAGVDYVSLRKVSRGHDACVGPEAWVNTLRPLDGDGVYLHPNAAGMRAVAAAVADHLKKDG